VIEGGYSIADVAKRLGITIKILYNWRDRYGDNAQSHQENNPILMNYVNLKLSLSVYRIT